jgi:hypothetical protein
MRGEETGEGEGADRWAPLASVAGNQVPEAWVAGGLRGPDGLGPA